MVIDIPNNALTGSDRLMARQLKPGMLPLDEPVVHDLIDAPEWVARGSHVARPLPMGCTLVFGEDLRGGRS